MHVVVVNVEALLGVRASTAAEGGVEDLPTWQWWLRLGDHDDDFGICVAFLEKSAH